MEKPTQFTTKLSMGGWYQEPNKTGWGPQGGGLRWRIGFAGMHLVLSQSVFIFAGPDFEVSEPRGYFDIRFGERVAQEAQELQEAHKLNKARRKRGF